MLIERDKTMADQTKPVTPSFPMWDIGITDEEVAERKKFLEFRDEDVERLRGVHALAQGYAEPVIDAFYTHLLAFEEGQQFFRDPAILERVKRMQREYFLGLTQGTYDVAYADNRLKIGAVHESIGLPIKTYLGMYNFYLRAVAAQ